MTGRKSTELLTYLLDSWTPSEYDFVPPQWKKQQHMLKRSHSCPSQYRSHSCCDSVDSDIAPAPDPAPTHHTTPAVPSSHPNPPSLIPWLSVPSGTSPETTRSPASVMNEHTRVRKSRTIQRVVKDNEQDRPLERSSWCAKLILLFLGV